MPDTPLLAARNPATPRSTTSAWKAIGPSADAFGPGWPAPQRMDEDDMAAVV